MEAGLSTLTYESAITEYDDFPHTCDPVYIMGEAYSAIHDRDELKADVESRLWITYRRGFSNIGGVGPSSDQGWGCMLRCGQMMLAQALILRHLGRAWRWKPDRPDPDYHKLLSMFEDKKGAVYSIHQIASMGESEGKAIGQWFGPNTIAQVLKRISTYDSWSNLAIHVALDNVVIKDDIYKQCRIPHHHKSSSRGQQSSSGGVTNNNRSKSNKDMEELLDSQEFSKFVNDATSQGHTAKDGDDNDSSSNDSSVGWKPLFLIIPLRLGLTDINPIYFQALKKCVMLPQSVGFIGGKPNHAHYFIGCMADELIYLDPHTTQPVVDLKQLETTDCSYHCSTPPSRMSFHKLDPSIALGFYCADQASFDDLCKSLCAEADSHHCMFEVKQTWPKSWSQHALSAEQLEGHSNTGTSSPLKSSHKISLSDMTSECSSVDDEEFEII